MIEEPLTGGHNSLEVVRAGDTVRRRRDPGSVFAAQVLHHLESAGYPYAPRHFGLDEQGRDVLSYIPGTTAADPAPGAYALAGRMLRELHEATAGHALAAGHECVLHGDPGPFNMIFQAGLPVAFIDWSSCHPGERLDDLGYLAWTWCVQSESPLPIAEQAGHLRELRDGYGDVGAEQLLEAMVRRQGMIIGLETVDAEDPRQPPERQAHARWAIGWATADRDLLLRERDLLLSALR